MPGQSWNAARAFVDGSVPYFAAHKGRLSKLIAQSNRILSPLADPLDLDLGAHRWLRVSREEAYSDWLAWILEQFEDVSTICKLFSISVPQKFDRTFVKREHTVSQGHEGCQGRLDILVSYDDVPFLAVEVKLGRAVGPEVLKHQGYAASLPKETQKIVLAINGETVDAHGFQLRRWEDVTVNLRTIVAACRLPMGVRAMMLAFVGAVEQNLLGYPGNITRYIATHRTFSISIIQHFEATTGGTSI